MARLYSAGLAFALGALCAAPTHGQPPRPAAEGARAAPLPPLDDWFLSTGSWADDPQLYVREVGSGRPVVMLHGGWGAEHAGLVEAIKGLESGFRFIFYDQRGSLRSPA